MIDPMDFRGMPCYCTGAVNSIPSEHGLSNKKVFHNEYFSQANDGGAPGLLNGGRKSFRGEEIGYCGRFARNHGTVRCCARHSIILGHHPNDKARLMSIFWDRLGGNLGGC